MTGYKPATLCAQGGLHPPRADGGVVPALQPATTFVRDAANALVDPANFYARYGAPNLRDAEAAIAALESAQGALLFASGMAAALAVFRRLPPGSHVAATSRGYFSILNWLRGQHARGALEVSFFDPRNQESAVALRPGRTRVLWIETPVNPTWEVVDIASAAQAAHAAGAILAVDATAMTPILTRPLELGADIVFHAATKYLNGHSDVLAGVLAVRDSGLPLWAEIDAERREGGAILGPFEAWLLLRGLRTLHLRVAAASRNAMSIATALAAHPRVTRVLYPGLPSHPQHAIAARQMTGGFGGMLSFCVGESVADALALLAKLKLVKIATSLGGVESLIEHRATVEGPASDVPPNLLRLSCGIEDADDLVADLLQALG